jgi:hypothetical protein
LKCIENGHEGTAMPSVIDFVNTSYHGSGLLIQIAFFEVAGQK